MLAKEVDVHPGLLDDLPASSVPRCLAGVEVPARLQPGADLEVAQQDDAAFADDEPGAGDVHRIGVAVERVGQP